MKIRYLVAALLFALAIPNATAQDAEADLTTVFNYLKYSDDLSSAGQIPYEQIVSLEEAGFDIVINLATVNESGNALEGFLVAEQGMTYLNIPVSWQEPPLEDVEMFFNMMNASKGKRVFVHCAANMRATAFVYLYRTLVQGVDEAKARADMETIWDPAGSPAWDQLIKDAKSHFGKGE